MKKRAVQAVLSAHDKALRPNSGNFVKNQIKGKFEVFQEHFTDTRTPTLRTRREEVPRSK